MQASLYDRVFVSSGPVVRVYKNIEDEASGLEYLAHLDVMKDEDGNVLEPENCVLHNDEQNLLFTDKQNESVVFNYNIEVGKIVEEYDVGKKGAIKMIQNNVKNGGATNEQVFNGITQKSIFSIDPRISKQKKIALEKLYKTDPAFNTIATTRDGTFAIGSLDGAIRLYSQVGKNASTLLPGMGAPILGIDVSQDGK
jgi:hypothetical protein